MSNDYTIHKQILQVQREVQLLDGLVNMARSEPERKARKIRANMQREILASLEKLRDAEARR